MIQEPVMSTTTANDPASASAREASTTIGEILARNWWAVALRGAAGIVFGLIALFLPGITMLALVLLFSAYMLVDGVFAIIAAVRAARRRDRWGLLTLEGSASLVTGVLAFVWPGLTILAFVILIAAWAIVTGMLMLAAAFRLGTDHGRSWLALGGAASLAFGALLIVAPPIGALVLTWWLGAYALVFGVVLLILAFKLRSRREDHPRGAAAQSVG